MPASRWATVKKIMGAMEERLGQAQRVWARDLGVKSRDNLA
jgi:hypothetical protein